jgi:hypothetical protein
VSCGIVAPWTGLTEPSVALITVRDLAVVSALP